MQFCKCNRKDCESLNLSFDLLIISPLKRALETYTNSNIKAKELMINNLFIEQKEDHPLNFLENESFEIFILLVKKTRIFG